MSHYDRFYPVAPFLLSRQIPKVFRSGSMSSFPHPEHTIGTTSQRAAMSSKHHVLLEIHTTITYRDRKCLFRSGLSTHHLPFRPSLLHEPHRPFPRDVAHDLLYPELNPFLCEHLHDHPSVCVLSNHAAPKD